MDNERDNMNKNLITIKPEDYGIPADQAQQVKKSFVPMLEQMEDLEEEFNQVVQKANQDGITDDVIEEAKDLRKKYVKIRTATDKVHKEAKAYFLQGGRFVDGWKNAQRMTSQGKEDKLKEIEEYKKRQEEKRIKELQEKRGKELKPFLDVFDDMPESLGDMDQSTWEMYLAGAKQKAKQRAEEARKREEAEKKAKEEQERIRKENEELKKKQEAARKEQEKIRKENERLKAEQEEAERKKKEEERQKAQEEKRKAEEERQKAEREKQKGDADKIVDLKEGLKESISKFEFKSEEYQKVYTGIQKRIQPIIDHLESMVSDEEF